MNSKYPLMKKRLLIITHQAGVVEAFAPVVNQLSQNQWECDIVAFDKSKIIWSNFAYHTYSEQFAMNIEISDYDLLLTDTSEHVAKVAFFWDIAKKHNIPSIAYVDSWENYDKRFTIHKKFDKTPDYIGLIDNLMYQRMHKVGAPNEKLVVLGYARFETAFHNYMKYLPAAASKKSPQIVFFTNPIGPQIPYTDDGYTTIEVVKFVLNELLKRRVSGTEMKLIFKPHPRENIVVYRNLIQSYQVEDFVTVSDEIPYKLLSQADIVFGLSTILLVDSSTLGIPTYSFQPGRKFKKNDITDRKSINVITNWEDIKREISKMIIDKFQPPKQPMNKENNTEIFVNFINQISDTP